MADSQDKHALSAPYIGHERFTLFGRSTHQPRTSLTHWESAIRVIDLTDLSYHNVVERPFLLGMLQRKTENHKHGTCPSAETTAGHGPAACRSPSITLLPRYARREFHLHSCKSQSTPSGKLIDFCINDGKTVRTWSYMTLYLTEDPKITRQIRGVPHEVE
jgi:hypothetical protein